MAGAGAETPAVGVADQAPNIVMTEQEEVSKQMKEVTMVGRNNTTMHAPLTLLFLSVTCKTPK